MTDKELLDYVNGICGETDLEIYQWYCKGREDYEEFLRRVYSQRQHRDLRGSR